MKFCRFFFRSGKVDVMDSKTHVTSRTRMTLLQKVQQQHDEDAWEELLSSYSDYIYVIVRNMNINPEDAGDIRQQVFIKLWKQLPNLDLSKMTRFRGYVATAAKNCAHDFIRKRVRESNRQDQLRYESELGHLESVSMPAIERIAENEWNNYVSGRAFKNIAGNFSKEALAIFKGTLAGEDLRTLAEKYKVPASTAYRLRNRIKESLVAEIKALNEYLG